MSNPIRINVSLAPLPTNFKGTPQAWAQALVERLTLQTESGFSTFVVTDVLPTTDEGPVFLNGTKVYVWDADQSVYVPLDITDSFTPAFIVSEIEPDEPVLEDREPPVWLKIKGTRLIGWYFWMGAELGWVPMSGVTPSGPTANRPVLPHDFEVYYDTDINVELWYERGQWRTRAGIRGDVKFVYFPTLQEALAVNPGWVEVGHVNSPLGQGARGRVLVPAHKDEGETPAVSFTPLTDITARAAKEQFGEEQVALTGLENGAHTHFLVNNFTANPAEAITAEQSINKALGVSDDIDYVLKGRTASEDPATLGVSSESGEGEPHANIQPSLALWCLVKL
jgi:microcystin-dependent protein